MRERLVVSDDGSDNGYLAFNTRNAGILSEAARIDSDGRLIVGSTTQLIGGAKVTARDDGFPAIAVNAHGTSANAECWLTRSRGSAASPSEVFSADGTGSIHFAGYDGTSYLRTASINAGTDGTIATDAMPGRLAFATTADGESAPTERMRIDSSGRLLVGTSSDVTNTLIQSANTGGNNFGAVRYANSAGGPDILLRKSRGGSVGTHTVVQGGDDLGNIYFGGSDGTAFRNAALINAEVDGAAGSNDMPGRLVFSTTADGASSPTERMRIESDGTLLIGLLSKTITAGTHDGTRISGSGYNVNARTETSSVPHFDFINGNGLVGRITTSGSSTSYVTSSDYRLKENVVPLTGAADRVNQLQVHRFNFIADPDTTVDGFLAHEVQAVVPECVTGTQDEVDADGDPVYQGIDQSKLVPLLTAALQEALTQIESLKARVTALEP